MGFSNYNPAERMSERLTLNCDMNTAYNAFLKAVNDLPQFKSVSYTHLDVYKRQM